MTLVGVTKYVPAATARHLVAAGWSSGGNLAELLGTVGHGTRRVAAGILQGLVFAYYPAAPDLMRLALAEVRRLGGTRLRPAGGLGFRLIVRLLGWRVALRIRRGRSSHG